jgi:hypothetical protein
MIGQFDIYTGVFLVLFNQFSSKISDGIYFLLNYLFFKIITFYNYNVIDLVEYREGFLNQEYKRTVAILSKKSTNKSIITKRNDNGEIMNGFHLININEHWYYVAIYESVRTHILILSHKDSLFFLKSSMVDVKINKTDNLLKFINGNQQYKNPITNIYRMHIKYTTNQQKLIIAKIIDEIKFVWPKLQKSGMPCVYRILLHSKTGGTGKSMIGRILAEHIGGVLLNGKFTEDHTKLFTDGHINIFQNDEFDEQIIEKDSSSKIMSDSARIPGNFELIDKKSNVQNRSGIKYMLHSLFDLSGFADGMNNVIIICCTNEYEKICEADPALITRFDLIEEMKHLDEYEATQFAKNYARDVYDINYKLESYDENMNLRDLIRTINKDYIKTLRV